ncbi:MAG: hypothetical protein K2L05_03250 [Muribaculaceae bacterium]|nr:hypothetical protein [Muribaculaceae bacterium]MDE7335902.1 hypothetical protein [Muribaculaceae bacterium]
MFAILFCSFSNSFMPWSLCFLLPVIICWLVSRTRQNYDNKNAEIITKAIEANPSVDVNKLIEILGKSRKNKAERDMRTTYLLRGCLCSCLGVALLIVWAFAHFDPAYDLVIDVPYIFFGLIALALGIAFLIVYFVTRPSDNSEEK